jgi:arsenite-transporting ATPase
MRIIIITGSGGSGVSTLAAATAVALGRNGLRTLAFSLNAGLGEAFGAQLAGGATEVAPKVNAVESRRHRDSPDELRDWLEDLLDWRNMDAVIADDVASLPGISHIGRLLELEAYIASGEHDAIVVDAAPVVQFLELPPALDAASHWLDRLFAPREQTIFEPFLRAFAGDYASTGEDVMERGRELLTRLARLRDMMTDPEICSVRIITAAGGGAGDRLRQAITGFQLFSYPADAVVLSRILPEEGAGDFFDAAAAAQKECLNTIGQAVGAMPVLRTSLRPEPPRGQEALAEVAGEVYAAHAPEAMLHRSEKRVVFHENGRYEMNLALPYAAKEDLSLEQLEDSVVVYLGGHRCVLSLPEEVRRYSSASWSFEEQTLKVTFSR